jgi:hypothetical protein
MKKTLFLGILTAASTLFSAESVEKIRFSLKDVYTERDS